MKVLKADASAGDAFAEIDLGANYIETWTTFDLAFFPAALTFWNASGSGEFVHLWNPGKTQGLEGVTIFSASWNLYLAAGGTPAANQWQTLELHHITSGASDLYVDTVLTVSGTDFGGANVGVFDFGQFLASNDPAAIAYIANVKIGTTQGASDLFSDDFSSGNLDAWTSTEGDVSVIDDPFVPPPSNVVYARVYGINLALSDDGVEQVSQLVTSPDGFS